MKQILDWQDNRQGGMTEYVPAAVLGGVQFIGTAASLVIQYSLLVVVLAVWSVVGFVFWIPLIARATVGFCVTAIYENLLSHEGDVPNGGLQHAAFFYVNGFRSIHRAMVQLGSDETKGTADFRGERFFAEALWAVLFWWVGLVALSYTGMGFVAYWDQLVFPVTWLVQEASATWAWLSLELEGLRGIT